MSGWMARWIDGRAGGCMGYGYGYVGREMKNAKAWFRFLRLVFT